MEFHAGKRDVYGIPIIKSSIPIGFVEDGEEDDVRVRSQREERERLRAKTENLRRLHYIMCFLEKWTFSRLLAKTCCIRTDQGVEDMSRTVEDEIEGLEAHQKGTLDRVERLLNLQHSVARYLIDLHGDHIPDVKPPLNPFLPPQWLLRAIHGKSHCPYSKRIGILSSGYMRSDPGSSFDDLIRAQVISEESLRNHCGGRGLTPFISMADDAKWLLQFVRSQGFPETTWIAFINVQKLELLGIVRGQARHWATEAGVEPYSTKNPDGVPYLGPTHWLAYGWVPTQCIDKVWSLNDFRQVCDDSGISKGSIPLLWLGS